MNEIRKFFVPLQIEYPNGALEPEIIVFFIINL